jgi:enolase
MAQIAKIRGQEILDSRGNPTWGAPRIQAELALLGYNVAAGNDLIG